MYRLLPLFLLLGLCSMPTQAQTDGLVDVHGALYQFLVRQQVGGHLPNAFLTHQPLSVYEAQRYLDTLATRRAALSRRDQQALAFFRGETPGPGTALAQRLWGRLYENGRDVLAVSGDGYGLQVNPVLHATVGVAQQQSDSSAVEATQTVWQTTRGLRASGHLGKYVYFETQFTENQRQEAQAGLGPVSERIGKFYPTQRGKVLDYGLATGALGVRSRYGEIRLARTREQFGPGMSSLFKSSYAAPYTQLHLRAHVWRLQYVTTFASFEDLTAEPQVSGPALPLKYGTFHRLALALPGRVELGLYESVLFAPTPEEERLGFYAALFTPVLFLRPVDADLNSPGNVLLGLDARWQALDGLQVHGSFFIDDFESAKFFSEPGYWKNTYGFQLGAHLVDLGLDGLDVRAEYSQVRPYVYSNRTPSLGYTHRLGVLGHPAGPNAADLAVAVGYRLNPRLEGHLLTVYTRQGRNTPTINYGGDPNRPYTDDRPRDADVNTATLQGIRQSSLLLEARAGYQLLPHFWVEGVLRAYTLDDEQDGTEGFVAPFVLFRWTTPFESYRL